MSPNNEPANSLSLFYTDAKEVSDIISKLKINSAPGRDNITSTLLKSCILTLAEPISTLCNLSFYKGTFPSIFKQATVCPIYKAGEEQLPSNYRPISLLPSLSKILEKIANKRLISFLEKNGMLASNQYGFRAQKSTDDAVLQLTTFITQYLDRGEKCVGVFLDLQKAFDTVSIPILLARLEGIGVRGNILEWFRNYLTDRNQQVRIGNHESDSAVCSFGVPQGSTLGPTLFLVYINELCKAKLLNAELIMFADDTVLLFHGSNWSDVQKLAEDGLSFVIAWLEDNLLSLNTSKTKYMCFKKTESNKIPDDYRIQAHTYPCNRNRIENKNCNCSNLERVDTLKYLGVIIDHKLMWRPHIESVSKRIRRLIHVFKTLRSVADHKLLIQTYKALGECVIGYCICCWGGAAKTHLIIVERAQRALLKVMMSLRFQHPTSDLYAKCQVLSVRKLFISQCIKKYHKEVVPFLPATNKRLDKCPIPRTKSAVAWRHYNHLSPMLYNKLNSINKIKKMNSFKLKKVISNWLINLDYEGVENLLLRVQ